MPSTTSTRAPASLILPFLAIFCMPECRKPDMKTAPLPFLTAWPAPFSAPSHAHAAKDIAVLPAKSNLWRLSTSLRFVIAANTNAAARTHRPPSLISSVMTSGGCASFISPVTATPLEDVVRASFNTGETTTGTRLHSSPASILPECHAACLWCSANAEGSHPASLSCAVSACMQPTASGTGHRYSRLATLQC